eukprot:scaffold2576_cov175-Amphora_coffeaeformis.AAC.4
MPWTGNQNANFVLVPASPSSFGMKLEIVCTVSRPTGFSQNAFPSAGVTVNVGSYIVNVFSSHDPNRLFCTVLSHLAQSKDRKGSASGRAGGSTNLQASLVHTKLAAVVATSIGTVWASLART